VRIDIDGSETLAQTTARIGERVEIQGRINGRMYPTHAATLAALQGRYGCDYPYALYTVTDVVGITTAARQQAERDRAWGRQVRASEATDDAREDAARRGAR
jgi:hypothetical protein